MSEHEKGADLRELAGGAGLPDAMRDARAADAAPPPPHPPGQSTLSKIDSTVVVAAALPDASLRAMKDADFAALPAPETMTLKAIDAELAKIGDPVAWMKGEARGIGDGVAAEHERRRKFDGDLAAARVKQQRIDKTANQLLERARVLKARKAAVEKASRAAAEEAKARRDAEALAAKREGKPAGKAA